MLGAVICSSWTVPVKAFLPLCPSPTFSQLCSRFPHRALPLWGTGRWASLLPGAGQSGCLSCSGTGRGQVLPQGV